MKALQYQNSIFHNKCRKAIFYDRVRSYAASVASCVTLERGRKRLLTRVLNYTFSNSIVLTENKIRNIQFFQNLLYYILLKHYLSLFSVIFYLFLLKKSEIMLYFL